MLDEYLQALPDLDLDLSGAGKFYIIHTCSPSFTYANFVDKVWNFGGVLSSLPTFELGLEWDRPIS